MKDGDQLFFFEKKIIIFFLSFHVGPVTCPFYRLSILRQFTDVAKCDWCVKRNGIASRLLEDSYAHFVTFVESLRDTAKKVISIFATRALKKISAIARVAHHHFAVLKLSYQRKIFLTWIWHAFEALPLFFRLLLTNLCRYIDRFSRSKFIQIFRSKQL